MQLEIIGCAGAWGHPQSMATSGYILSWDDTRLLIDCGHGVVGQLLFQVDPIKPPTDIYISHHHADHTADLVSLAYAFKFGPWKDFPAPNLYCHPDTYTALKAIVAAHGGPDALEGLNHIPLVDKGEIGGKQAQTFLVPHLIDTYALRIENFAFSADTGPEEHLPLWAKGAQHLLCEAAMPPKWESVPFHLNPAQAGELAQKAGAEQLLLTHLPWLDDGWQAAIEADCAEHFTGTITIVKPGQVYQL